MIDLFYIVFFLGKSSPGIAYKDKISGIIQDSSKSRNTQTLKENVEDD